MTKLVNTALRLFGPLRISNPYVMSSIDNDYFEDWMLRLLSRLEYIEKLIRTAANMSAAESKPRLPAILSSDKLLDNSDLCNMLKVSKRTLQRYRSTGELPYQILRHKTLYKGGDVRRFMETNFDRFRNLKLYSRKHPQ